MDKSLSGGQVEPRPRTRPASRVKFDKVRNNPTRPRLRLPPLPPPSVRPHIRAARLVRTHLLARFALLHFTAAFRVVLSAGSRYGSRGRAPRRARVFSSRIIEHSVVYQIRAAVTTVALREHRSERSLNRRFPYISTIGSSLVFSTLSLTFLAPPRARADISALARHHPPSA